MSDLFKDRGSTHGFMSGNEVRLSRQGFRQMAAPVMRYYNIWRREYAR